MKKIYYFLISLIFLTNISACSGYKPIFGSTDLKFKIADHQIIGDKKIGNQIYSRLYNLSQSSEESSDTKNIYITINTSKNKNATSKNSAGKILAYSINLSTRVTVKDFITNNQIFIETFDFASSYKVQSQHSETIKLENKSIEDLINKTYQDLVIKLSNNIL